MVYLGLLLQTVLTIGLGPWCVDVHEFVAFHQHRSFASDRVSPQISTTHRFADLPVALLVVLPRHGKFWDELPYMNTCIPENVAPFLAAVHRAAS